jgi:hypothetical protein
MKLIFLCELFHSAIYSLPLLGLLAIRKAWVQNDVASLKELTALDCSKLSDRCHQAIKVIGKDWGVFTFKELHLLVTEVSTLSKINLDPDECLVLTSIPTHHSKELTSLVSHVVEKLSIANLVYGLVRTQVFFNRNQQNVKLSQLIKIILVGSVLLVFFPVHFAGVKNFKVDVV